MTKDERPAPTPPEGGAEPSDVAPDTLWTAFRLLQSSGPTQQLGVHVSKEVHGLLREVSEATGIKQRALVEYALTQTYGTTEGRKLWQKK